MPFETLPTVVKSQKDALASIAYRRPPSKRGATINPKLIIGIPKAYCGDFKPKATQRFALTIGTGADKGKARIVPAADGPIPRLLKGGAAFRFGFVPMLGQDAADREYVAVKSVEGGFEIDLPAWFKADAA